VVYALGIVVVSNRRRQYPVRIRRRASFVRSTWVWDTAVSPAVLRWKRGTRRGESNEERTKRKLAMTTTLA
jgi:hypothetical protein